MQITGYRPKDQPRFIALTPSLTFLICACVTMKRFLFLNAISPFYDRLLPHQGVAYLRLQHGVVAYQKYA